VRAAMTRQTRSLPSSASKRCVPPVCASSPR
jgi:hypothetical protein